VARRIEEELGDRLTIVWTIAGVQRYTTTEGRTRREEGRALIGFLDGTSNLDPRTVEEDRILVFVDPARVPEYPPNPAPNPQGSQYGDTPPTFPADLRSVPSSEPQWTTGGTYMVVRASLLGTPSWDKQTLDRQQKVVGRFKWSGAYLDLADERELVNAPPAFATNQAEDGVPFTAHVRKANPRLSEEDEKRRIFRRGYPLIQPTPGGVQRGLVFICFARTTSTQFEFILRAWIKNPDFPKPGSGVDPLLQEFEQVLLGGYYFVPPLEHINQQWSWTLPPT
jgi:Dyp-type peroxidase family